MPKRMVIDIELKEGKKIVLSEVSMDGKLLTYQGRQVVLYIQDHGDEFHAALEDGSEGRRFHLTFCRTLREMKRDGLELYIATSDFSGQFHITGTDPETGTPVTGKTDLVPCRNCLEELGLKRPAELIFYEVFHGPRCRSSRNRRRYEYPGMDPSLKRLLRRWV